MTTKALSNGAVAVRKSALPAAQEAEWKAFKAFNKFVKTLDELVEYYDRLERISLELDIAEHSNPADIPSADQFKRDKARLKDDLDRCREAFRCFDRDGDDDPRYDEEGKITFQSVSVRLGVLMGSFTNAKPGSPEVFGRMLVHHVLAVEPTVCEIESACRALVERKKDFPPEITEIVAAVRSEKPRWAERRHAFERVDELRREIITSIPEAKARAEEAIKEKAAQMWVEAKERAEHVVVRRYELNEKGMAAGVDACRYVHVLGIRQTLCDGCRHHRDEELVAFVLGIYQQARTKRDKIILFAVRCAERAWLRKESEAARPQLDAFGAALAAARGVVEVAPQPFVGYWTAQVTIKWGV